MRSPIHFILAILALVSLVLAAPLPEPIAAPEPFLENLARAPHPDPIKGGASFSPLEALRNRGNRLPQRSPLRYYSGNIEAVREVKYL